MRTKIYEYPDILQEKLNELFQLKKKYMNRDIFFPIKEIENKIKEIEEIRSKKNE